MSSIYARYVAPFSLEQPSLPNQVETTWCDGQSKVSRAWQSHQEMNDCRYSTREKAFYPVLPYNTQTQNYMPVTGHFDISRLRQTHVLDLIYSPPFTMKQFGVIPVSETISPLINKMGTMQDQKTGESLGTCTLIANNLVMVARHAVQGRDVRNIHVRFGQTEFNGKSYIAGHTSFQCVIEEDLGLDYAIIQLNEPVGQRLGHVPLSAHEDIVTEPVLLHYPLQKSLKVSVHSFVQTTYQTKYLLAYHDSDYFSSGGAYFDPLGRMNAMHLGSQLEGDSMNLIRYAVPLKDIVNLRSHSFLALLATGELSQANSYTAEAAPVFLPSAPHNYLMDEEGYQSEKILRNLLRKHLLKDKKIGRTKTGAISFSKANLEYIASKYPREYKVFLDKCSGITGTHGLTKQYSVKGCIESDHTLPHDVWKSTTNPKMRRLVSGGGSRPGENEMPAMTIPYDNHRELRTTGSSTAAIAFRKQLIRLCNANKIDDALTLCFNEYALHGINLKDYQMQIDQCLKEHVLLKVISTKEKQKIMKKLFP
ncbi:MAG: trypsin-like peptidase domain-containing protein [Simkania sp.]|nr:trypsin-like peptidase domain-containing protein [Simkania sp.]